MRKALNTSVSALAVAMGIVLSSQSARAADPMEQAYGPDWYVSVFAGGVQTDTIWNYASQATSIDHKTGFTIGGAIGTHLAPGLRTELELSYARSENNALKHNDKTIQT